MRKNELIQLMNNLAPDSDPDVWFESANGDYFTLKCEVKTLDGMPRLLVFGWDLLKGNSEASGAAADPPMPGHEGGPAEARTSR